MTINEYSTSAQHHICQLFIQVDISFKLDAKYALDSDDCARKENSEISTERHELDPFPAPQNKWLITLRIEKQTDAM